MLTHKPEREALNLKPRPDPNLKRTAKLNLRRQQVMRRRVTERSTPSLWSRGWTLTETWKNMNALSYEGGLDNDKRQATGQRPPVLCRFEGRQGGPSRLRYTLRQLPWD